MIELLLGRTRQRRERAARARLAADPGAVWVDTVLDDEGVARLLALDDAGARVIVGLASGRGRGGAEVDALFGMSDEPAPASLAWAGRFRRALFDRAVGQGAGVVLLAGEDGAREAGTGGHPEDAPDAADVAWDGAAGSVAPVSVWAAPDREREAQAIAAEVARAAAAVGGDVGRVLIAHAELDAVAGALEAALADHGLFLALPGGRPLVREPIAQRVRAWLGGGAEGLALLAAELATPGRTPRAEAARAACAAIVNGAVGTVDRAAWDVAIAEARVPGPAGGVRAVPLEAFLDHPVDAVVIGGLSRGAFGASRARYVLSAAVRDCGSCSLVVAGEPHPVVLELVEASGGAVVPAAATGGARSAAVRRGEGVDAALAARRVAQAASLRAPTVGPWDGLSGLVTRGPVGVTAAEAYLACPARYGLERVLGLGGASDAAPDVSPDQRGAAVHAIVERFAPRLAGLRDRPAREVAVALHAVATEVLATLDGAVAWADAERDKWLAGLVDDRPLGVLAAWLAHERASERTVHRVESAFELAVEDVVLRGRIDRVDRLPEGGWLVIDYKSGRAPNVRRVARGLVVQPLVYAAAVDPGRGGEPVATAYLPLSEPDLVRLQGLTGDDALMAKVAPARAARLPVDRAERAAALAYVADGVRRLQRGVFHPTVAEPDEVGCATCGVRHVCRRDPVRAAVLREGGDAAVQRPLPPGAA